jgi:cytochrome c-type biogenesis protein CcmH
MTSWILWVVVAIMTAEAVLLLLRSLFSSGTAPTSSDFDRNVYRDQLKEVERERAAGQIGAAEAEAARAEIGRRLLATPGEPRATEAPPLARPPRGVAFGIAVLLPVAGLAIYLIEGTPNLPSQPFARRDQGARIAVQPAAREGHSDRATDRPIVGAPWAD